MFAFPETTHRAIAILTILTNFDVPDEGLKAASKKSNEQGYRIRSIVALEDSETCAHVAQKVVLQNIQFLEPIWKQAKNHSTGGKAFQDSNLVLYFGDGSQTNVYIRHVENETSQYPISNLNIYISVKVVNDDMSCVVDPNGMYSV